MLLLSIFIYIFMPFFMGLNSIYLLSLCYVVKAAIDVNYRNILVSRTVTKEVFRLFLAVIPALILAMLVLLINGTRDVSFILPLINQLYKLLVGLFVYAHFLQKKKSAIVYCIYAFAVQAVMQTVSFFSSNINTFFNMFRDPYAIEIGTLYYGGYRGLVVGAASFFSVSAAYALIFVIVAEYWDKINISKYIKLLVLAVMCFAAISAGRTAFVGMAMAVAIPCVLSFINLKKEENKVHKSKKKRRVNPANIVALCGISIVLLLLWLLDLNGVLDVSLSKQINEKIASFLKYAFEFVYNFLNGNGFTTVSTDVLQDMYFPVSMKTFVLGDGLYTGEFGGYYMSTDAGYMRQILYFGIIGFFSLVCFQMTFFMYKQGSKTKLYSFAIIILLFVLHYKGEVIGYLHITQGILLLRMLSEIHEKNDVRENYTDGKCYNECLQRNGARIEKIY